MHRNAPVVFAAIPLQSWIYKSCTRGEETQEQLLQCRAFDNTCHILIYSEVLTTPETLTFPGEGAETPPRLPELFGRVTMLEFQQM